MMSVSVTRPSGLPLGACSQMWCRCVFAMRAISTPIVSVADTDTGFSDSGDRAFSTSTILTFSRSMISVPASAQRDDAQDRDGRAGPYRCHEGRMARNCQRGAGRRRQSQDRIRSSAP